MRFNQNQNYVRIRQAISEDFTQIDTFDVFAGDRNTEIGINEIWVAIVESTIAGYITFNYSFYQKPFIQYVNVRRDFRGQGIAQALIGFIEGVCKNKRIFTSTESNNLIMLRLLKKRSYQVVGVIEKLQEFAEIVYCKELKTNC